MRRYRAFTLMEILIAIAIIGLALSAVIFVLVGVIRGPAKGYKYANEILVAALGELNSHPARYSDKSSEEIRDSLMGFLHGKLLKGSDEPLGCTGNCPRYSLEVEKIKVPDTPFYRVLLRVKWKERGRERYVEGVVVIGTL